MKNAFVLFGVFLVLLLVVVAWGGKAWSAQKDARWKKVEEAKRKGLPKTAIEQLEPIIVGALKDKAYAEAIRAISMKIALESTIQGNRPEEKVTRMEAELAGAPEEMKPVMEAILANWYWHYFQQNRYRFLQRTQTQESPGEDFTTWDLARILSEIDKQFDKALAHEKVLKATPIGDYNDLLQKGTVPDSYRPTLFDFLAFNALEFYTAGEQAGAKAEDAFELSPESPIFGSDNEFLSWRPETADSNSPTLKAVRLYQSLLAFHRNDRDRTAFLDADLWRLHFGKNKAAGEEKDARYKAALRGFLERAAGYEISARVLFELASVIRNEGNSLDAHGLAKRGMDSFPNSIGARMCFNLVQEIQSRSAGISTERVWNEPLPTLDIKYRNVTRVFFRAVQYDFDDFMSRRKWGYGALDRDEQTKLLSSRPVLEWSADLPPTVDFRERMEKLPAPAGLKPGSYYILASHDPSFKENNNQVSYTPVWVSNLALVMRSRNFEGLTEGFVLNALTGDPVAGAAVRGWARNRRTGSFEPIEAVTTDENGLFRINRRDDSCVFLARHGEQRLATSHEYFGGADQGEPSAYTRTVFFTDRSLYRPGQTVQYKGICMRIDQAGNQYKTLARQAVTVRFSDPNGKAIGEQVLQANDYGAFSGSFTAPRDRLTGRMTIAVQSGPSGSTSINVEEYKRPRFQVELMPPGEAARLNTGISVPGKATSYTGAAVGDAKVSYRVVREVRFPVWCWWGLGALPPGRQPSQAIAHGVTTTKSDGSFTISFVAKPDMSVREKDEPTFEFTVHADVTDTTGETRSMQRSVRVGYTALQASLSASEWQTADKPVEIAVSSKSLDGEGRPAAGKLKVYSLKEPAKVARPDLAPAYRQPYMKLPAGGADVPPASDRSDPNSWELGKPVGEQSFQTDDAGTGKVAVTLKPGIYRVMLETGDNFGKTVTALMPLQVLDPKASTFPVKIPNCFTAFKWSVEPGESLTALWGTGYSQGRAFVEIEHRGKTLRGFWTAAGRTQEIIQQPVTEDMRGGFALRVTYVRENRAYLNERIVDVPWTDKKLAVKWEHFNSKLQPGAKETWTAVVTGPDAKTAVAEMVAGLYDTSLDAYLPHQWMAAFTGFRQETSRVRSQFENQLQPLQQILSGWRTDTKETTLTYRAFSSEVTSNLWGYDYSRGYAYGGGPRGGVYNKAASHPGMPAGVMAEQGAAPPPPSPAAPMLAAPQDAFAPGAAKSQAMDAAEPAAEPQPDLSKVTARKNLNETAFFFPHLLSGADGTVKMEFTMPEALTEWKFMGFAHDRELRGGLLTDKAVTAKDLMVEPNPPRFVREGDTIEFTVKVSNQADTPQTGKVNLTFSDARTLQTVDAQLSNTGGEQSFEIPPKESRGFAWRITVPDAMDFLTYKAVGATGSLSDGEEGYLPVLSRRILVTESLPLPIRGKQTKEFSFKKLLESGQSPTLQNQSLTVQMVSQPAWYAVMALPFLMEFPYECSEQTFNRLYANALSRHIANSDPKIRRIFDLWKDTPALDSPMEKNQDLKAVMIEETPWLRQAQRESAARKDVGILFDRNRLDEETRRTLGKLSEQQLADGAWPWFPGGPPNDYITLYITTGFGRLRHLGVDIDVSGAVKSLGRLDSRINYIYREILKNAGKQNENHLDSTIALYLYGRSFFLKDRPIEGPAREAVDYFLGQAKEHWLQLSSRQSQAHLAVALNRFGDRRTAADIMKSIKERSVSSEELGMYWRDTELSWWWYRAPIETQAMMIEAFGEVTDDARAVEDCKVWLLKQKQTQNWKTTKATADAVYALLLRGTNLLASDALVEVSLADQPIRPEKVEAGTGYYEKRFIRGEIKPEFGNITVTKADDGVSWGSVHWQYLEDMTRVTPYERTPLKLKKSLFIKTTTEKGQVLKPVTGPLAVGDELVVRIELRVDRDMEYVHMKDQRGSGTEPVSVLSRYKFQDGLAYYESTRDTAGHFFIDYLPKGVYVFEYSTRVQLRGKYQTGIAGIQCMYAPEFNSHSESFELEVK